MEQQRVEPTPIPSWYQVVLEVPVTVLAFTRKQARARVIEAFRGIAMAFAAAGEPTFMIEKPHLRLVKRGPRLVTDSSRSRTRARARQTGGTT